MLLLIAVACHTPPAGSEPAPPDPFVRVEPAAMPIGVDAWAFGCDGDDWVLEAETIGPAEAVELALFDGAGFYEVIVMDREPAPDGAVWTRWVGDLPAERAACGADDVSGRLRVTHPGGSLCRVRGRWAAPVLNGAVPQPPGSWEGC